MKYHVRLQAGGGVTEGELELRSAMNGAGNADGVEFRLRGIPVAAHAADCAELTAGIYSIIVNGCSYEARLERADTNSRSGPHPTVIVRIGDREYQVEICDPRKWRRDAGVAGGERGTREVRAPMPGRIVKVLVEDGQRVAAGDGLVIIEAMKMQNEMRAPGAGRVAHVYVAEGSGVEAGEPLVRLA